MAIYRKYHNFIECVLFPVILLLYPFLAVNQGIDVADSTYSLTNFQYFPSMDGTWTVATFLSNVTGWLFMQLPFGGTLLGMKCYTTLVQSATALMVYFGLKKRIPAPLLFFGEFLALGLCWCPSTILYNYLTYFLMTAGILLIYRGITDTSAVSRCEEAEVAGSGNAGRTCVERAGNETEMIFCKKQRLCFMAAGVCLGANVAVRMPNVVQAAFILAVWYGIAFMCKRQEGNAAVFAARELSGAGVSSVERFGMGRESGGGWTQRGTAGKTALSWRRLAGATGWCLLGYVIGFGIPLAAICVRYGVSAYPDMVYTMFAMTEQAVDYKPTSMVTGMLGDYAKGLYWLAFAGICAAAAGAAFFARERLFRNAYRAAGVVIKIAYVLLLVVLLRFYWGRGMFHFRYYEYGNGSVYYLAVLFLLVTIAAAIFCLIGKRVRAEQKLLAAFVLLQIFLTPLGSNNDLYPIINNLFVAAPFFLWVVWEKIRDSATWRHGVCADAVKESSVPGGGAVVTGNGGQGMDVDVETAGNAGHRTASPYGFLWKAPVLVLTALLLVQSVGLHLHFAFQDGIYGEPRMNRVKTPQKAAGIYTTLENGALLEELSAFIEEEGLTGKETITYGELPGLYYLLDMPPALSTGWPDLDSYRMAEYTRDMAALKIKIETGKEPPVIIVSSAVAAYWSDDGEAINWFGVNVEKMAEDEKQRILGDFVREYGYMEVFGNARYVVFNSREEKGSGGEAGIYFSSGINENIR